MEAQKRQELSHSLKKPKKLSDRITWLRDYYFSGTDRKWNNEFTSWTTGTTWDIQYSETNYYIVPETYTLLQTLRSSYKVAARKVILHSEFWEWSLPERRAWFVREVVLNYLPHEILPGDLLAGARFNIQTSLCFNKKEAEKYDHLVLGKKGARSIMKWFHDHGYGNAGATSGHLIPDHERLLTLGWKGLHDELLLQYNSLTNTERSGKKGKQLKAMLTSATMARELALKYSSLAWRMAETEEDDVRKQELVTMALNLEKIPWETPKTFWEALQALWINHMLIMSDENYPGPGTSFGRIDQYLLPYWEYSLNQGMDREFGKELLKCFWVHCNTAYDAMIRTGNQGISAGFGQLITLSGMGPNKEDMTNDLTYVMLEVIDEMSPILEPKPNIRLHRNSPEELLQKITDMIASSQGAPFLINFDERSMAGMMREAERANLTHLINDKTVHDYAPVGCLENTMVGNDRSGTVDCNLNLLKGVELALNNGKDLLPFTDPITGQTERVKQDGPKTGKASSFKTFDQFFDAYKRQTEYIIKRCVDVYEVSESIRAGYFNTPYLSCMVKGCADKGLDITEGGAEISLVTMEAVTYATTVDSLLAIKYLVFDQKRCTLIELIEALKNNWEGYEVLQAMAKNRAPKYGRDNDEADQMAQKVMNIWTEETWKQKTVITQRQFRPGMLSWNYWAGDGFILPASPDGRKNGQFLSNAICPSNGADINGPTANTNSVGTALGGKSDDGNGDWGEYYNALPNGASHTITFNPSLVKNSDHRERFKAFLKGYIENGGTALQINMLDPEMLKDAQNNPENYQHLLVRITGYNAYFVSVGRELQNEVIARLSHNKY